MNRSSRAAAGPLLVGAFALLIWQERRSPLRNRVEPPLPHHLRNFALASLGAATMAVFETPLIQPLARLVEKRRWGLFGSRRMPEAVRTGAALVAMDYSFYAWHVLLHRWPFLWRFHAVHHVDLDLDVSTALRFHFGELLLSVPWRAAQVLAIGLTPRIFSIWQVWFALSVMFHHSNIRLPIRWEQAVSRIVVTPRVHGIHHSIRPEETNSNWSSGLSIWDWLHGTQCPAKQQYQLEIGVPAFCRADQVRLPELVAMPFREQPDYWGQRTDSNPPVASESTVGGQPS